MLLFRWFDFDYFVFVLGIFVVCLLIVLLVFYSLFVACFGLLDFVLIGFYREFGLMFWVVRLFCGYILALLVLRLVIGWFWCD